MSTATNQMGGAAYPHGASSTEEGENDDRSIASQVEIQKLHKRILQRIGLPEGRILKDTAMVNYLLDIKLALEAQNKRIRMETPLGIVQTVTLNLVAGGTVTHIDFEDSQNTVGVPSGNIVNEPQARLYQIHVYNDGPGAIAYSLNLNKSRLSTDLGLLNGENKSFTFDIPTVRTLNVAASSTTNAKVRIITLI